MNDKEKKLERMRKLLRPLTREQVEEVMRGRVPADSRGAQGDVLSDELENMKCISNTAPNSFRCNL